MAKKKSKVKEAVDEMAARIRRDFAPDGRVACGIVYCLSRNDCEKVAAELQARARPALAPCLRTRLTDGSQTNEEPSPKYLPL